MNRLAPLALALPLLAACSPSSTPPPQAAEAAKPSGPSAAQSFALYQQMVEAGNAELAVPLGDEILAKFPDSAEAATVRESIEALREKARTETETRRLSRLWAYQVAPMGGGRQSTASINARDAEAAGKERVRLVLRRHTEWGESVFLYGNEPGFGCAKPCRITMQFDDQPKKTLAGSIPPTGEPAIFIEDDKPFVAAMQKAKKVAIDVREKGGAARTLVFEVGGFDATKFEPMPKSAKQ
ncbi:hypothetical protein [Dokdonella sp.]|uniref:hypothetical protein n=1 Tax=Dokdonella sp. TaxID=2291710 RepID=UPI0025C563EF|nr:hypothetical protein [Dokdonella sp.]MBX3691309.1 hypothetical protein [Dokdonella sp.]MCW5567256.1 hypothetical protein [Dokdonella sp.]